MTNQTKITRPLTDESWVYWQKLVSDEHDRQAAEIENLQSQIAAIRKWAENHQGAWWLTVQLETAMQEAKP